MAKTEHAPRPKLEESETDYNNAEFVASLEAELEKGTSGHEAGTHLVKREEEHAAEKQAREERITTARAKIDELYDEGTLQVMAAAENIGRDKKTETLETAQKEAEGAPDDRKDAILAEARRKAEGELHRYQEKSDEIGAGYHRAKLDREERAAEHRRLEAIEEARRRALAEPLDKLGDMVEKHASGHFEIDSRAGDSELAGRIKEALGTKAEPFYAVEIGGIAGGRIMELYYQTADNPDTVIIERRNLKTGELVSENVVYQENALERSARSESLLGRFRKRLGWETDLVGPSAALEKQVKAIRKTDSTKYARGAIGLRALLDTSIGSDYIYSHINEGGGDFESLSNRTKARKKHRRGFLAWLRR